MGVVHSDRPDKRRVRFEATAHALLSQALNSLPLDAAVDHFAASRFIHDRLPPRVTATDASKLEEVKDDKALVNSKLRLRTRHVARLAIEDGVACLYHHCGNTRKYHEVAEPPHIDFAIESAVWAE